MPVSECYSVCRPDKSLAHRFECHMPLWHQVATCERSNGDGYQSTHLGFGETFLMFSTSVWQVSFASSIPTSSERVLRPPCSRKTPDQRNLSIPWTTCNRSANILLLVNNEGRRVTAAFFLSVLFAPPVGATSFLLHQVQVDLRPQSSIVLVWASAI